MINDSYVSNLWNFEKIVETIFFFFLKGKRGDCGIAPPMLIKRQEPNVKLYTTSVMLFCGVKCHVINGKTPQLATRNEDSRALYAENVRYFWKTE